MEYTFYQLAWFFLIYSFLGWFLETALAAVRRGRLLNRGFLNAPFSPSYGLGAVLFAVFLPDLRTDPFFLFLGGMLLATALELLTGMLLEKLFGQKWWDYSEQPWNFNGYICLKYAVAWGLFALFCLYLGNPLLVSLTQWIPPLAGRVLLLVMAALLLLDLLSSLAAVLQLSGSLRAADTVSLRWRALSEALDNGVTRHIQRRMARAYPSLARERLRPRRETAGAQTFAQGCGFYKLAWVFLLAALLGDLIETVFCRLKMGVWMSRSSLIYGPFSIVWGFGAVMLTALLYRYRNRRDGFLFAFGTVLGGAYEYGCSVLSELLFGTIFWDYSAIPFNLGGRINLLYCFFWGIATVVWIKGIYPKMSSFIELLPMRGGKRLTWIMAAFMVLNMAVSAAAFARYVGRNTSDQPADSAFEEFLDRHYPDERIRAIYPDAKILEESDTLAGVVSSYRGSPEIQSTSTWLLYPQ